MILVGNQRGGAKDLATHLLKEENDHVQVHELRGFASDNLTSALNESYAISRATRCKQFLYSLSLNPPPDQRVGTDAFEDAINRAEERLGLSGQPRAIVFHEKEGRRHAHAVWSRIRADEMKAVQMSHDREKLMEVSRELYREHGWKMPRGMMKSEERDPCNFSLEEWQQAKRAKADPKQIKEAFQDCWAVSDSRAAFAQALESRGYKLARGDRRGFVAVDRQGEVYAVSRWAGVKTRDVRARLGEEDEHLPSVEQRRAEFARETTQRLRELRSKEEARAAQERMRKEAERKALVRSQAAERERQTSALQARWDAENAERQSRYNRGWRGLVDHFSGRLKRIREQNMAEAYRALLRDRAEKDALIFRHLEERRELRERDRAQQREIAERRRELAADIRRIGDAAHVAEQPSTHATAFQQAAGRDPPPPDRNTISADNDRESKRDAFMRTRREQGATRERIPRRDLER